MRQGTHRLPRRTRLRTERQMCSRPQAKRSGPGRSCQRRKQTMEPLWSPVAATGGNRSQMQRAQKPPNQAETAAVGCDRLPRRGHGKEGVDGSSLSEGSAKAPHNWAFCFDRFVAGSRTWGRYGALYRAFRSKTPPGERITRPRAWTHFADWCTYRFTEVRQLEPSNRRVPAPEPRGEPPISLGGRPS